MNSCQRQYQFARKELQALQAARPQPENPPQPEEATTTSESPGSFYTNAQSPATAAPKPAPQPAASPAETAETSNRQPVAVMGAPSQASSGQ
jgi:hypothetical protein